MASPIPIPQDVVDEIIGHLQGDVAALANCSAVAHALHLPSRKLLFSRVTLNSPSSVFRLHALLRDAPVISTLIHTLHLRIFFTLDDVDDKAALLLSISCRLYHLQHISIGGAQGFPWERFSKKYIIALETLVSSADLRSLELSNIFLLPVHILTITKALVSLSMQFVTFKNDTSMTESISFSRLEALHIGFSVQLDQANLFKAPKLRQLSVRGQHRPSLQCALDFIGNMSRTIEDFTWCSFGYDDLAFINPILRIPFGVRHVSFEIGDNKAVIADTWSSLLYKLNDAGMAQSLERLTITTFVRPGNLEPPHIFNMLVSNEIDNLITDTSRFPALSKVDFVFNPIACSVAPVQGCLVSAVQEKFPNLHKTGTLKVSFRNGTD